MVRPRWAGRCPTYIDTYLDRAFLGFQERLEYCIFSNLQIRRAASGYESRRPRQSKVLIRRDFAAFRAFSELRRTARPGPLPSRQRASQRGDRRKSWTHSHRRRDGFLRLPRRVQNPQSRGHLRAGGPLQGKGARTHRRPARTPATTPLTRIAFAWGMR